MRKRGGEVERKGKRGRGRRGKEGEKEKRGGGEGKKGSGRSAKEEGKKKEERYEEREGKKKKKEAREEGRGKGRGKASKGERGKKRRGGSFFFLILSPIYWGYKDAAGAGGHLTSREVSCAKTNFSSPPAHARSSHLHACVRTPPRLRVGSPEPLFPLARGQQAAMGPRGAFPSYAAIRQCAHGRLCGPEGPPRSTPLTAATGGRANAARIRRPEKG